METHAWLERWHGLGRWIWHGAAGSRNDTALFYKRLEVPEGVCRIRMAVSADNRYILWVCTNDHKLSSPIRPVGRGPARADPQHTSLDEYEIAVPEDRTLHLYAQVRWMPGLPEAPMGEHHTATPGFLLMARFEDESGRLLGSVGTDASWWAARSLGVELEPMPKDIGYLCIGMAEHIHASGWPGWWLSEHGMPCDEPVAKTETREGSSTETVGHAPDQAKAGPPLQPPGQWHPAVAGGGAALRSDIPPKTGGYWSAGPEGRPWLIQRQIAMEEAEPIAPKAVHLGEGAGDPTSVEVQLCDLQPGQECRLVLDMGEMLLAYPMLRVEGSGTVVETKYAEVLVRFDGEHGHKSFDLASGHPLWGYGDRFTMDVAGSRWLEPTHWRSFRFMEIRITAGPKGGSLLGIEFVRTGYPIQALSRFEPEGELAPVVRKMDEVSWRTIKCCTWETYMDCPFYEQMQYVGDTRLQCLVTYVVSGDASLPAQALRAFHRSRIVEGLTQSRAPSIGPQIIPTFSLIYLMMVEDYLDWAGDDEVVAEVRPGMSSVLDWFLRQQDSDTGLLPMPAYWLFVDWVSLWRGGVPPYRDEPGRPRLSALINLHLLLALQSTARVLDFGSAGSGECYRKIAANLIKPIRETFVHQPTGLIADVPVDGPVCFSQHAQALAVLAGVLEGDEARHALSWAIDPAHLAERGPKNRGQNKVPNTDPHPELRLAPTSFYFRFYLAEALAKMGMGGAVWPMLEPFREAMERGSTTWPESYEPCRSECHAWGSWPMYFFHRHVLGVTPTGKGDGSVKVEPGRCPPFEQVTGRTVLPRHEVSTKIRWSDQPEPQVEYQIVDR